MKTAITVLILALAVSTHANAGDVYVYCKDGSKIRAQVISISTERVKIDPEGPITLRTIAAAEIDSIVSMSGGTPVIFPLADDVAIPSFGKYREESYVTTVTTTKRWRFGASFSYRADKNVDEFVASDEFDNRYLFKLRLDRGFCGGFNIGYLFPTASRRSYVELYSDILMCHWGASLESGGVSAKLAEGNFLALDFGVRPMFLVAGGATPAYVSPFVGFGLLITNIDQDSSPYSYYPTVSFDAEATLLFGASLDVFLRDDILSSLFFRARYGKLYLDVSPYLTYEVGISLGYVPEI